MPSRRLWIIVGTLASFFVLFAVIVTLSRQSIVTVEQAGLMSVALFGLYVGFGILVVVYRLINKLD